MDGLKAKYYIIDDIHTTKNFLKKGDKKMRKKDIEKEFERLNGKIGSLETIAKGLEDDNNKLKTRIDILEFAGTFDMNKVEINIYPILKATSWFGYIPIGKEISCKYIFNDRVENAKYEISEELYEENHAEKPQIISDDGRKVLFTIGKHLFVLSKDSGQVMELPYSPIEKKAKEKK